ncbi:MAG TPA: MFS transporter [Solirubrobacteraceae bacterium]|jgi:EmrB/QacA subfamily drug resistance transporter|nr:MFS transporter [Solirubrobacteraceae bacterium]
MPTTDRKQAHLMAHSADYDRRWLILAVLCIAQLMVVLDATVVNIALPSAQKALHFSDGNRQWMVTAYTLAFGSLLLLGGRLSDLFGRKRTLVTGLVGFAIASAVGGAAQSFDILIAARVVQGIFAAILAPAALSLLTTTFTDRRERGKAFGVFGAISGAGAAIGLLVGGLLTEYLSWRWSLYVNLVFAAVAVTGVLLLLSKHSGDGRPRLDLRGTLTGSAGLFALVYGFSEANRSGWGASSTLGFLAAGVALLAVFVAIERHSEHALLPLWIVTDRNRGGALLAILTMTIGMFGVFLFLTYYLQQTLLYSPVKTGLAFLPMIGVLIASSTIASTALLPRFGPRLLVPAGLLLAAIGMVLLTGLDTHSTYAAHVLPGLLVLGVGVGLVSAPAMNAATLGVDGHDAGVGSATVNTAQQVGGSLGTALLNTLATTATTTFLAGKAASPAVAAAAAVHGYTTAFWWTAGIFSLGALLTSVLLRSGAQEHDPAAVPALAH